MINEILNSKPAEALTNFLTEILGTPIKDRLGLLFADALKIKRVANLLNLEKKYHLVKPENTKAASLSFGYQLLEKASLEENEDILQKWANLLANATDKNYQGADRKIFIDILNTLEPSDAQLFDEIVKVWLKLKYREGIHIDRKKMDIERKESVDVLFSMGLIKSQYVGASKDSTDDLVLQNNLYQLTELGHHFYKAVNRETKK